VQVKGSACVCKLFGVVGLWWTWVGVQINCWGGACEVMDGGRWWWFSGGAWRCWLLGWCLEMVIEVSEGGISGAKNFLVVWSSMKKNYGLKTLVGVKRLLLLDLLFYTWDIGVVSSNNCVMSRILYNMSDSVVVTSCGGMWHWGTSSLKDIQHITYLCTGLSSIYKLNWVWVQEFGSALARTRHHGPLLFFSCCDAT
jgi:hypothetical protein